MHRGIHRLTDTQIEKAKRTGKPRMLPDGGCLYLQDGASWLFRYGAGGKRYMGLGPLALVDLKEARELAHAARKLLHDGVDPIARRNGERTQAALAATKSMTFDECCATYINAHRSKWRHPKSEQQWKSTLAVAAKTIGKLPVRDIDLALVLKVLEPIWSSTPDTASRLRGRIEAVLGWAAVRGYRTGDNPARWKGHLDHVLPAPTKLRKAKHHAALPYAELPQFMILLQQQSGVEARALEFVILTSVRTGDVIGGGNRGSKTLPMMWSHVDLEQKTWVIPKTKVDEEHCVPLADAAVKILQQMQPLRDESDVVFPGSKAGRSLSETAMLRVLHRMGRTDLTVHGFRSTFKDWAGERTNFPREVIEACMSHTISDKIEAAYRRGTFFDKRARLMSAWAGYATEIERVSRGR